MNRQNLYRILKSEYPILLFVIVLTFLLGFIPHNNYPYPVHIDEWMHLARAKALLQAESINFIDPYASANNPIIQLETGFYLFWAMLHQITGISWLAIFKFFPAIIFVFITLSVYILARREGFGWQSAFFTSLIPTTIGMLGPGFLVPVALGLLFIPLSLFVVFNLKSYWAYLLLFFFTCFLLAMHAATAVGLVIVLCPVILFNLKGNFKHSLGITLTLVISFVLPFSLVRDLLVPTAQALIESQTLLLHVDVPWIVTAYGYFPILFCMFGIFLLTLKGGKKNYSLVFGLLALIAMLAVFFTFQYGLSIMYYRGLMYTLLMMSVVAGAGLLAVNNLRLPAGLTARLKAPSITGSFGGILCLVFVIITLVTCIPARIDTPYYHVIDDQDYDTFVWIHENIGDEYARAILDPWKATAFIAITGKGIWTRIHSHPRESDERVYQFLEEECADTAFLLEKGITIVYTRGEVNNPDLVKVSEYVYLLDDTVDTD